MSADVKTVPEVAGFEAPALRFVAFHVATSVGAFDDVEKVRPAVPEDGGDDESRDVTFE